MFTFLKNNKQYIVIDAGSHKIAAIAFQILGNKPSLTELNIIKVRVSKTIN